MTWNRDDFSTIVNIVCCAFGIGSLGLPHTWGVAGPYFGSVALIAMGSINIYAATCLCKCLLHVSTSIETFSDLGEHVMGKYGRYLVVFNQFSICLLVPTAFLILGGSVLLPGIFGGQWTANYWIPLMAIALLPIVLIRTLKEATWVSFLGVAGSVVCVVVALASSLTQVPFDSRTPEIQIENVFTVFGIMALSYGVAVIVPTLQREHPNPSRLPMLVMGAIAVITVIYGIISLLGYIQFGCTTPNNLLLSMKDNGWKKVALVAMQVHVSIAFAVILNPALYSFERSLITMDSQNYHGTPKDINTTPKESLFQSAPTPDIPNNHHHPNNTVLTGIQLEVPQEKLVHLEVIKPYSGKQQLQSYIIRSLVVALQVFIAMLLQSSFSDFVDFIGATTVTMTCIILPLVFYLRMFNKKMKTWEKILCVAIILLSAAMGVYTAVKKMESIVTIASKYKLFEGISDTPPQPTDEIYPACKAGQRYRYYNSQTN